MAMNYDEANLNNAVWYSFLNRSETIYKARECLQMTSPTLRNWTERSLHRYSCKISKSFQVLLSSQLAYWSFDFLLQRCS